MDRKCDFLILYNIINYSVKKNKLPTKVAKKAAVSKIITVIL